MTAMLQNVSAATAGNFDVNAITDSLTVLADWRDSLRSRIQRAQMIFELYDVDFDLTALAAEVTAFRKVCACIAWRGDR